MNLITSELFKYVRDKKNLNQAQFAKRLGINQSTVSRIENGTQKPRHNLIKRLNSISGKTTQELLTEIKKHP